MDSAFVGMIYLMRRAVTTRDDGSYAYADEAGFALLTRASRRPEAPGGAAPLPGPPRTG